MTYALIIEGVVRNLIRLHPMNAGSFANAVPTDGLPVAIGDTYENGKFYREGVEITMPEPSEPTDSEDMQAALEMLEVRLNG